MSFETETVGDGNCPVCKAKACGHVCRGQWCLPPTVPTEAHRYCCTCRTCWAGTEVLRNGPQDEPDVPATVGE